MNIKIIKHINLKENNRIEFLLLNYDYFDGNDIILKFFEEDFQMKLFEKIEGLFSRIIKIRNDTDEYNLIWHEDVGNYIFSSNQDIKSINELEERLEVIVGKLNGIVSTKIDDE